MPFMLFAQRKSHYFALCQLHLSDKRDDWICVCMCVMKVYDNCCLMHTINKMTHVRAFLETENKNNK
jgi:hypothetical protein